MFTYVSSIPPGNRNDGDVEIAMVFFLLSHTIFAFSCHWRFPMYFRGKSRTVVFVGAVSASKYVTSIANKYTMTFIKKDEWFNV